MITLLVLVPVAAAFGCQQQPAPTPTPEPTPMPAPVPPPTPEPSPGPTLGPTPNLISQLQGNIIFATLISKNQQHQHSLNLINANTARVRKLLDVGSDAESYAPHFTPSPDGGKVAYFAPDGYLSVLTVETGEVKELSIGPGTGEGYIAWSPDGTKLAYVNDCDLYVVKADGSGEKKIASHAEGEYVLSLGAEIKGPRSDQIRNLIWADSGENILFDDFALPSEMSAWKGAELAAWNRRVRAVNLSTSIISDLCPHATIRCSVGNQVLIYTPREKESSGRYILMNSDGSDRKTLENRCMSEMDTYSKTASAPDGSAIVFTAVAPKKRDYPGTLRLVDIAQGRCKESNDYAFSLIWSPDSKYIAFSYFGRGHPAWKELSFGTGFDSTPEIRVVDVEADSLYPSETLYHTDKKMKIYFLGWLPEL